MDCRSSFLMVEGVEMILGGRLDMVILSVVHRRAEDSMGLEE
jgi:hypothetical protein